jgi:hypothetical protein
MFSMRSVPQLYNERCELYVQSEMELRVQSDLRQEYFIEIWSDSFCVKIRCQETTSEDGKSQCVCDGGLESVQISDSAVFQCD